MLTSAPKAGFNGKKLPAPISEPRWRSIRIERGESSGRKEDSEFRGRDSGKIKVPAFPPPEPCPATLLSLYFKGIRHFDFEPGVVKKLGKNFYRPAQILDLALDRLHAHAASRQVGDGIAGRKPE